MRVVISDYIEVEIPIVVFYFDRYWYWNEDDFCLLSGRF